VSASLLSASALAELAVNERENRNLIHVKNGKEALDICMENQDIDEVLMDIKMPVMNDNEAMHKINGEFPDLPVITQTAYSRKSEKQKP